MTTSKTIRVELLKKMKQPTMYSKINKVRKKAGNSISNETAIYVVASLEGINVHKILKREGKENEASDLSDIMSKFDFGNNIVKKSQKPQIVEKKIDKSPYDIPLSKYYLDAELTQDCKMREPYRNAVKEALLTLETKIQTTLGLDSTHYGVTLINDARDKDIFKRMDKGEEEGLYFLFRGVIQWLRNPAGHKKVKYTKEDALKIVLFSDHLIKLFDDLVYKRI